jgi:hypothetical protein
MGRRSRRRGERDEALAPVSEYRSESGDLLVLRGVLSVGTRREYEAAGAAGGGATREDAWQRAAEFLFERLALRWEIAGAEPLTGQRELLGRYRFASQAERRWIRDVLREHVAEHFPDVAAP